MFLVAALACCAIVCADDAARADPLPPPDPRRGERYDGRLPQPRVVDDVLVVPRLLLGVPRLALRGVVFPLIKLGDWALDHSLDTKLLELTTSDDGTRGIRPNFGYLLSFRPTVGLTFFDRSTMGPGRFYTLDVASGGPDVIELGAHLGLLAPGTGRSLDLVLTHRRRDDQLYTGLDGMGQGARFGIRSLDVAAVFGLTPWRRLHLWASVQLGIRDFFDGSPFAGDVPLSRAYCLRDLVGNCAEGIVDERLVPGFARGTRFVRPGLTVRWDTRDSASRPRSGTMLEAHAEFTTGIRDDESVYTRTSLAAEEVVQLSDGGQVLVLALRGDTLVHVAGPAVPFTERISLGGPDDLRGARPGQYRGLSSVLGTVEYRWPIWLYADATLFCDVGAIGDEHFELEASGVHSDVGTGVRIVTRREFVVRAQVAYGWSTGWQTLIAASPGW